MKPSLNREDCVLFVVEGGDDDIDDLNGSRVCVCEKVENMNT